MRKIGPTSVAIATATLIVLMTSPCMAHGAERGNVKATIGGAHVTIDYGRPVLHGRDMLAQIKPGQVWRIGADAPTTLESDKDLDFGGTIVPKGKHILLARFDAPGKWTLVFSSKSVFEYDPSAKIAEVPLSLQETGDSVEMVTLKLADRGGTGALEIAWGKMRLSASFKPA
jgi:hypothetical protein